MKTTLLKSSNNKPDHAEGWEKATYYKSVRLIEKQIKNILTGKYTTQYAVYNVRTERHTHTEIVNGGFCTKSLERAQMEFVNRSRALQDLPRICFQDKDGKNLNPHFTSADDINIKLIKRCKHFADIENNGKAYRVNRYGVVCTKNPVQDKSKSRKFWYSFTSWNVIDFQTCHDIRDALAFKSEFKANQKERVYFYKLDALIDSDICPACGKTTKGCYSCRSEAI